MMIKSKKGISKAMTDSSVETARQALKRAKEVGAIKNYIARTKLNGGAVISLHDGSKVHTKSFDDTLAFLSMQKAGLSSPVELSKTPKTKSRVSLEMIQKAHEDILAAKARKQNKNSIAA
jgi:hypothetical protein